MGPHVRRRIRRISLIPIIALRLHLVRAACAHTRLPRTISPMRLLFDRNRLCHKPLSYRIRLHLKAIGVCRPVI